MTREPIKIYVFFGPPSSGKSYLGKNFAKAKGYFFYEADDDYIPEYRERGRVSVEERQKVYNEFYSKVIAKTKELLNQGRPVVIASALGKNANRRRFINEFNGIVVFVLIESEESDLIQNAIKREFPALEGKPLSKKNEESLRTHLLNKIKNFEQPDFAHITIQNDYTNDTLKKLAVL